MSEIFRMRMLGNDSPLFKKIMLVRISRIFKIKAGGGFIAENKIWWCCIIICYSKVLIVCQHKSKWATVAESLPFPYKHIIL